MKYALLTLLLTALGFSAIAQFDPSAQKYLDDLAQTVQNAPGLSISFDAKISSLEEPNEVNNGKGKLLLKQNYHKLEIGDQETYGDGINQWIFFPDEKEVTIQPIEEDEITPASIFTIYKKGYRFRLLGENDNKVIVELSPEDQASSYVRITLYIDIAAQQLDAFAAQGKNGMVTSVNITAWETKALVDNSVIFNVEEYPGIDIIDLR